MISISGNIQNTLGEPLMGANVYANTPNGKQGGISDFDGDFNVNFDQELSSPITISYMGYKSKTFSPEELQNSQVILEESIEELDTVFITNKKPKSKKKLEKNKLIGIISVGAGLLALGIILVNINRNGK
jgi:hypothetical protein